MAFDKGLPAWLSRILCHGGKISFSFYLLHMAMLHLLAQGFGMVRFTGAEWADALLMVAVSYGATWALAALSYSTIEEPFLRLRRSYGVTQAPAPAGSVGAQRGHDSAYT